MSLERTWRRKVKQRRNFAGVQGCVVRRRRLVGDERREGRGASNSIRVVAGHDEELAGEYDEEGGPRATGEEDAESKVSHRTETPPAHCCAMFVLAARIGGHCKN